ncbi:MAG TPA: NAD(P)-dependent oxidoreductase [Gemmatimonadaceae bacterium]
MKIAVVGASGFIGRHLVDRLLSEGHEIAALLRSESAARAFREKKIKAIPGNVADKDAIEHTIDGSDVVVNLARAKAHGAAPRREVDTVNIEGARLVARAAMKAGARLIHASSTAVYGSRLGELPASEHTPPATDSIYALSKLHGEAAVRSEHSRAIILRISAVLGPRADSWLSLFRSARNGTLRSVGDGSNLHHPVDVEDVVNAIGLAIGCSSNAARIYNVAGPAPITMRQLAELMGNRDRQQRFRSAPPLAAQMWIAGGRALEKVGIHLPKFESVLFLNGNRAFDLSLARRELAFEPRIDIAASVARTARYFESNGLLQP